MTRRECLINTVINTGNVLYIPASGSFSCMPECILNLQKKDLPTAIMLPSYVPPGKYFTELTILSFVISQNNDPSLYKTKKQ